MSKPLSSLTDKALVREYQRIHAKIDKALTKLVEQGLGDVKPSDMMRGRDTTYASDKTCLAFIFKNRYPKGLECPKCERNAFVPVEGRRSYACACGYQVYPTEGTIFHKSPTPLTLWFHAIFLMSQSKNGVAAKELERQLGVTYKCAWRMAKQIRLLMGQEPEPLGGLEIIEADETYVGGVRRGKRGRGAEGKTPVFGVVERKGEIKTQVIPNVKQATLIPLIERMVPANAVITTDESNSYNKVKSLGHLHETVRHGRGEYVRGDVHTINQCAGQLKVPYF